MVDGFDVIGLNRDIGQANHVALKSGNNEAFLWVRHTNQKIVKQVVYRTFSEWELSLLWMNKDY